MSLHSFGGVIGQGPLAPSEVKGAEDAPDDKEGERMVGRFGCFSGECRDVAEIVSVEFFLEAPRDIAQVRSHL